MVSGDYSHVHVASGDDQVPLQMDYILFKGSHPPLARRVSQRRVHPDQNRWSESYSSGIRSRSSSLGNSSYEIGSPNLKEKPSYDMGWIADEKDETGLTEDETDDDQPLTDDHDPSLDEERTSAALIADEGRGLIVQADSTPIVHLQVQPGEFISFTLRFGDLTQFARYDPSSHGFFNYSKCRPRLPQQYATPNMSQSPCIRYLGQLFRFSSSCPCHLYKFGRT